MSAAAGCELIGRWRIVEADLWDRDYLDLVEPAYMSFGKNGRGEFYDQEPAFHGRSVLVRQVWSDITPNSHHFEQAFSKFVQSQEAFDLWFKQRVFDVSGLDLNNPPELALPEVLSVYTSKHAVVV